jgi:hypothetical protein
LIPHFSIEELGDEFNYFNYFGFDTETDLFGVERSESNA